jgi:competence protein ComEC
MRGVMLDVGHGTAIVGRSHRAALVYDTGPAWPGGRAAATSSLLPFLHRAGVGRVELAVLSHADIDHTGGAGLLAGAHAVSRWLVGPGIERDGAAECAAGQRWHSAGITIEAVWPVRGALARASDNDNSCVLRIVAGRTRLLVTGDVEARAERELVALRAVGADAITVPHHGSVTSSTPPFIKASAARLAIVSARPGGRWPLPAPRVASRWRAAGATLAVTSGSAIGVGVCAGRGVRLQDPDPWAESGRGLW